eukprot:gene8785-6172_t
MEVELKKRGLDVDVSKPFTSPPSIECVNGITSLSVHSSTSIHDSVPFLSAGVRRLNRLLGVNLAVTRTFALFLLVTLCCQYLAYTFVWSQVGDDPSALSHPPAASTPTVLSRRYFYRVVFFGAILTGTACIPLLPLDLIKCRVQVGECTSLWGGLQQLYQKEAGGSLRLSMSLMMRGWVAALIGSQAQGSFKFLFYEYIKSFWVPDPVQLALLGPGAKIIRKRQQVLVFLLSSAASEALADVLLIPWETVKIQMQTATMDEALALPFVETARLAAAVNTADPVADGGTGHGSSFSAALTMSRVRQAQGGLTAFYRGLVPLWMRQIPYTAGKFVFFELSVKCFTHLYFLQHEKRAVKLGTEPQEHVSGVAQLCISVLSGLIAGALSSLISHPADSVLSKLNHQGERRVRPTELRTSRWNLLASLRDNPLFQNIWDGVLLRMSMGALMTAVQWLLYDSFKNCFFCCIRFAETTDNGSQQWIVREGASTKGVGAAGWGEEAGQAKAVGRCPMRKRPAGEDLCSILAAEELKWRGLVLNPYVCVPHPSRVTVVPFLCEGSLSKFRSGTTVPRGEGRRNDSIALIITDSAFSSFVEQGNDATTNNGEGNDNMHQQLKETRRKPGKCNVLCWPWLPIVRLRFLFNFLFVLTDPTLNVCALSGTASLCPRSILFISFDSSSLYIYIYIYKARLLFFLCIVRKTTRKKGPHHCYQDRSGSFTTVFFCLFVFLSTLNLFSRVIDFKSIASQESSREGLKGMGKVARRTSPGSFLESPASPFRLGEEASTSIHDSVPLLSAGVRRLNRLLGVNLAVTRTFALFLLVTLCCQYLAYTFVWSQVGDDPSALSHPPAASTPTVLSRRYFYRVVFFGGLLAGFTHCIILPLDLIKCRVQVGECTSLWGGLQQLYQKKLADRCERWSRWHLKFFKSLSVPDPVQAAAVGPGVKRVSKRHQIVVFLLASSTAEMMADLLLVPWETVKVQMQTAKIISITEESCMIESTGHGSSFSAALTMSRVRQAQGGLTAFYRGLVPLWMRQIPYTAGKFVFFELSVKCFTHLYFLQHEKRAVKLGTEPQEHVSGVAQLCISVLSGLIAGALSSLISHPADSVLSKLNHQGERRVRPTELRTSRWNLLASLRDNPLFQNIWDGVLLRMSMGALLTAVQWLLYDSFKITASSVAYGLLKQRLGVVSSLLRDWMNGNNTWASAGVSTGHIIYSTFQLIRKTTTTTTTKGKTDQKEILMLKLNTRSGPIIHIPHNTYSHTSFYWY